MGDGTLDNHVADILVDKGFEIDIIMDGNVDRNDDGEKARRIIANTRKITGIRHKRRRIAIKLYSEIVLCSIIFVKLPSEPFTFGYARMQTCHIQ